MKMDKKGNVPTTILVIGVFVVCLVALISFIVYILGVSGSFIGLGLVEKVNVQVEDYNFYHDLERVDARVEGNEVTFYQEKIKTSGFLWWKKERVLFSVEYSVPK